MILDSTVTIQKKSSTQTAEGMTTVVWTASQTTELANKQPLSGELAYKEYGISDAGITNLFFLKASTVAVNGDRIVDSASNTYEVCGDVGIYSSHAEVVVRPVVS